MTDYAKTTNFTAKDALAYGDANKKIKGAEHDTEYDNIQTAVATKANKITSAVAADLVLQAADGDMAAAGWGFPNVTNDVIATHIELNQLASRVLASTDNVIDNFPAGTLMLFQQTSAPTGWTKQTTHNDKALRVVSGTASSGGTSAFSTVFGKSATDSALSTNVVSHSHTGTVNADGGHTHSVSTDGAHTHTYGVYVSGASGNQAQSINGAATPTTTLSTSSSGSHTHTVNGGSHTHTFTTNATSSGTAHSHGMDIRVQYVDLIIASKD